jgi:small subunit ribosomal protein S20
MAHHKSTIKRIRTNEKSRLYNKAHKSEATTAIKAVLSSASKEEAQEKVNTAFKLVDKLAHKNIIHKNKAANKKSQLSKFVNSLS